MWETKVLLRSTPFKLKFQFFKYLDIECTVLGLLVIHINIKVQIGKTQREENKDMATHLYNFCNVFLWDFMLAFNIALKTVFLQKPSILIFFSIKFNLSLDKRALPFAKVQQGIKL